jgi:hypothetical protein
VVLLWVRPAVLNFVVISAVVVVVLVLVLVLVVMVPLMSVISRMSSSF